MRSVEELAEQKFGEPNVRISTRRELRFGRKGSICVQLQGEKAGAWFDHEAQEGGWLTGCTEERQQAEQPAWKVSRLEWDDGADRHIQNIIRQSTDATGTPTELYLNSRAITRWPRNFVRHCPTPHGALWIAVDTSGREFAIQHVYLTEDGRKSTTASVPKRTRCVGSGWHHFAAVRLPGKGTPILCEGVETGLSIWMATGRTVLCGMGIHIFAGLRLDTKRMTFAIDGNEPNSPAAEVIRRAIASRRQAGRKVTIARPPVGMDFNDIHQRDGLSAVADMIKGATS